MVAEDKKSGDMSVEDILKSIKGIITNHNKIEFKNYDIRDEEILELTDIIKEGKRPQDKFAENEYLAKAHKDDYIEAEAANIDANVDANVDDREKHLVSKKSAFEAGNMLKNFAYKATTAVEGKKTKNLSLEELVVEMMKPQLSKWLNDNLPRIVKELVEKEIKRLALDE